MTTWLFVCTVCTSIGVQVNIIGTSLFDFLWVHRSQGGEQYKTFFMSRRHHMMKMHNHWSTIGWCRGNKWLSHRWHYAKLARSMITSSNGNIFRFTGHLCGEFTSHRWIPFTKASDAELDVFFDLCLYKRLSKQSRRRWFETSSRSLWCHCNDMRVSLTYRYCHVEIHCWMKYI